MLTNPPKSQAWKQEGEWASFFLRGLQIEVPYPRSKVRLFVLHSPSFRAPVFESCAPRTDTKIGDQSAMFTPNAFPTVCDP